MTGRPGIETTVRLDADGGSTPNAYSPFISAHVRIYWPPRATDEQIEQALSAALNSARACIQKRRHE